MNTFIEDEKQNFDIFFAFIYCSEKMYQSAGLIPPLKVIWKQKKNFATILLKINILKLEFFHLSLYQIFCWKLVNILRESEMHQDL